MSEPIHNQSKLEVRKQSVYSQLKLLKLATPSMEELCAKLHFDPTCSTCLLDFENERIDALPKVCAHPSRAKTEEKLREVRALLQKISEVNERFLLVMAQMVVKVEGIEDERLDGQISKEALLSKLEQGVDQMTKFLYVYADDGKADQEVYEVLLSNILLCLPPPFPTPLSSHPLLSKTLLSHSFTPLFPHPHYDTKKPIEGGEGEICKEEELKQAERAIWINERIAETISTISFWTFWVFKTHLLPIISLLTQKLLKKVKVQKLAMKVKGMLKRGFRKVKKRLGPAVQNGVGEIKAKVPLFGMVYRKIKAKVEVKGNEEEGDSLVKVVKKNGCTLKSLILGRVVPVLLLLVILSTCKNLFIYNEDPEFPLTPCSERQLLTETRKAKYFENKVAQYESERSDHVKNLKHIQVELEAIEAKLAYSSKTGVSLTDRDLKDLSQSVENALRSYN